MIPELKGKGLFVFSDPGGAKPILSFIKINQITDYLIISDRQYVFFEDFGLTVTAYIKGDEIALIERFKPDYIFTGTSYTSLIELVFIELANKMNILTNSFIDHYTNYPDRFLYMDKYVFPKNILLTDFRALEIAKQVNLDKQSSLVVCGNFYHIFLQNWSPIINRTEFFGDFVNHDDKVITFAPDPLSNVGGRKIYGFDEKVVWNDLALCLKSIKNPKLKVVINLHPNQNKKSIQDCVVASAYNQVLFADKLHTNTLIYYSDLVIGMYSSFLVEAKVFQRPIVRYLPNASKPDSLSGNNIGTISKHRDELKQELKLL